MANLRLLLETKLKPRLDKSQKNREKKLLEQGRKKGKDDFLRKISNASDVQRVNAV